MYNENSKYSFVVKGSGRTYSGGGSSGGGLTEGVISGRLFFNEYYVKGD